MSAAIDPTCAFHGKKWSEHDHGRCLYCCICFKTLTPDECAEDLKGQKWDVCTDEECVVMAGLREVAE